MDDQARDAVGSGDITSAPDLSLVSRFTAGDIAENAGRLSATQPGGADPPPAGLAHLLDPGEVVLWVGSPAPDRYAKQMEQLWTTDSSCLSRIGAFALAALLIAPLFLTQDVVNKLPSSFVWVFAIVGVAAVLGVFVLVWRLGVRYLATKRAATTIYAITDKRVIDSNPWRTRTYLSSDLDFLTVRRVSNAVGDVLFTVEVVPVDESEPDTVEHGLIGVQHPHDVARLLRASFPLAPFAQQSRLPGSKSALHDSSDD